MRFPTRSRLRLRFGGVAMPRRPCTRRATLRPALRRSAGSRRSPTTGRLGFNRSGRSGRSQYSSANTHRSKRRFCAPAVAPRALRDASHLGWIYAHHAAAHSRGRRLDHISADSDGFGVFVARPDAPSALAVHRSRRLEVGAAHVLGDAPRLAVARRHRCHGRSRNPPAATGHSPVPASR